MKKQKEKEDYSEEIVWLAKQFHEAYEFNSSIFGWKTQKSCRVPFNKLPEKNKEVMLKTCKVLIPLLERRFGFIYSNSNKCPYCRITILTSDVVDSTKRVNQANIMNCPDCNKEIEVFLDVSVCTKKIVLEEKKL